MNVRRCILRGVRPNVLHRSSSTMSPTDDAYQFLERSRIPTYHFQPSLPRLPVPKLDKTCDRYLSGIRPITAPDAFEETKKIVDAFRNGEGKELQSALEAHDAANKHTSYISEPWFDMYLRARVPVCINYNAYLAISYDPRPAYNEQLTRATNVVIAVARFKRSLDDCVLTPEIFHMNPKKSKTPLYDNVCRWLPSSLSWYGSYAFKAFPLDMSQHRNLFNTTRIPRKDKDEISYKPGNNHMVVLRQGRMYKVPLLDDQGQILPPAAVHASLADILQRPSEDMTHHALGVFTTLPRDDWAGVREQLLNAHGDNSAAIDMVDSALFVLCLDDGKKDDPMDMAKNLLMGDNCAANRWFDKSFSLTVDAAGTVGLNFEHSWGDGVAVLRMIEDVYKDSSDNHFVHPDTAVEKAKADVKTIDFHLTDALKSALKSAQSTYKTWCARVQLSSLEYDHMSRASIKKHGVGPDAVMQLAIQTAYYRMTNGQRTATYESCSTSAFRKGRTETMRPATMQTNKFVDAITGAERPSNNALRAMINDCSATHGQLVKEASMGQGFDRHLMGLKITAERLGMPIPRLYGDPVYGKATQYVLSTSTLSTNTIVLGGFGPVVENGFGIGYNVVDAGMGGIVSTYRDKQSASQMTDAMAESLDDIKQVLDATSSK